jgi:DNA uptake protein ComE-like DNA-binding protein
VRLANSTPGKWLLLSLAICSLGETACAGQWLTFTNCRYLPNAANDGDSFHVRADGREYIFRLYFVDAPETDVRILGRVKEQAKYFHLTVPQTLQIGREAERFTRQKLARVFTVRTCKQDARGRSRRHRYFAFVQTENGDLGEMLVANGLARVYGAAAKAPQMNTPEMEWHKLERLERKAKQKRIGGWGIATGRLNARATTQPGTNQDYFDALVSPLDGAPPQPGARFDLNAATSQALQHIPGIGPVLASRIIAARPFKSVDELQKVKGIKAKKYAELRPYFK